MSFAGGKEKRDTLLSMFPRREEKGGGKSTLMRKGKTTCTDFIFRKRGRWDTVAGRRGKGGGGGKRHAPCWKKKRKGNLARI